MSYLYSISDAQIKDASKELLGGKGYGLWKMTQAGLPVPPAYILTTKACRAYMLEPANVMAEIKSQLLPEIMAGLKKEFGYMPLVSVRSGARDSMPGMLDTILNVGLCKGNMEEWEARIGKSVAENCASRLVEMYNKIVGGTCFALSAEEQLLGAIEAVFKSWNNERAKTYRKLNSIPDDIGTAVIVQAMVYGNMNERSGTGVAFSRNFSTGEKEIVGDWLAGGQGEDVVAGTHNTKSLSDLGKSMPEVALALMGVIVGLEKEYRDMVDVEFTVQDGKLYILQVRPGKRSSLAAVRIAVELVEENIISVEDALNRIGLKEFLAATRPTIDPKWLAKNKPHAVGIAASNGAVSGAAVFSSEAAVKFKGPCILIVEETTPDDIAGMNAAVGILTATGGTTSHAAVVARGMDKVCVVGCTALKRSRAGSGMWTLAKEEKNGTLYPLIKEGDQITIDGATGAVWLSAAPFVGGATEKAVADFLALLERRYPVYRVVTTAEEMAGAERLLVATYLTGRDGVHEQSDLLKLIEAVDGREAVYDLRSYGHFVREADAALEYMFGDRSDPDTLTTLKVKLMVAAGKKAAKNAKVLGLGLGQAQIDLLKKAGFEIIPAVSTVGSLLSANGLCTADFAALLSVMNKEDITRILALKKNAGETVRSFNIVEELEPEQFGRNALFAMSPLQTAQSFLRLA